LTSFNAYEALRNMKTTNPALYEELTTPGAHKLPASSVPQPEDKEPDTQCEDLDADESNLPVSSVINSITTRVIPTGMGARESGALMSTAEAENIDLEPIASVEDNESAGRGKRRRMPNKLYSSCMFWRHNDDESSDAE